MPGFEDDPIVLDSDDRLNRSDYAKLVVDTCKLVAESSSSSVLGLIGPWGSGKTSILNLVEARFAGECEWRVIKFNPWLFSDVEILLANFFAELAHLLPKKTQAREKLARYVESVSPLGKLTSVLGGDAGGAMQGVADLIRGDTSAERRREELENALQGQSFSFLLVIDDIDRLQPNELLMIFKLIRLVGRLPRLYYLICFDETTILDLLERSDVAFDRRDRAQSYLEKIIQVRLDLPPLQDVDQWDMFLGELEGLTDLVNLPLSESEEERIFIAFNTYMRTRLRQPRAVKRLLAQMRLELLLPKRRLDLADLLVLTFIRVFEPKLYESLPWAREDLAPRNWKSSDFQRGQAIRRDRWAAACRVGKSREEARLLGELLNQLFPALHLTEVDLLTPSVGFKKGHRVGDPRYFDSYFQLGVGYGGLLSDKEIDQALGVFATGQYRHPLVRRLTAVYRARPTPVLWQLDELDEAGKIAYPEAAVRFLARHYYSILAAGNYDGDPPFLSIVLANGITRTLSTASAVDLFGALIDEGYLEFVARATLRAVHPGRFSMDWGKPVSQRLAVALQKRIENMATRPLEEISESEFALIFSYSQLGFQAEVRRIIEALVADKKWKLKELLARIPQIQRYVSGDGIISSRMTPLYRPRIEQLVDIDKTIRALGWEMRSVEPCRDFEKEYRDNCSMDARQRYVLAFLKELQAKMEGTKGT